MVRWKYKTLPFTADTLAESFLDRQGFDGWELVSTLPMLVFKRPESFAERDKEPNVRALRPGLLSMKEAGEYLGFSRTKLHELIVSGQVPSVKIGRSVRIPAKGLSAWLDEQVRSFGH